MPRVDFVAEQDRCLHCGEVLNPQKSTTWTLNAVRIGSENEAELRPAVDRTLDAFGDPVAVMRDLGGAGSKAVEPCRQRGIPDLLCQYHFLAAVGHKLLDGGYALLRNRIEVAAFSWTHEIGVATFSWTDEIACVGRGCSPERAGGKGRSPAEVRAELAARRPDKSDPDQYADRTVGNAERSLAADLGRSR